MSLYLNQDNSPFIKNLKNDIYVDKTLLIKKTNRLLGTDDGFMCVTRPRRFGKSMALSMLNAYYSKGCDSRELFKSLKIYGDPSFEEHLNKHNVIWIDMAVAYTLDTDRSLFLKRLKELLYLDLKEGFPELTLNYDPEDGAAFYLALNEIYSRTGAHFVFLIDEWDVVFRESENDKKLCEECLDFYRNLFKGQAAGKYIDLVYMTGILPIKRYNSQSALNNFIEYTMLSPDGIADSFGFTESEVKTLCEEWNMDFAEVKSWYDGYRLEGMEIYNPRSVVRAMTSKKCEDYWKMTGGIAPVVDYMSYDGGKLKGKVARMLAGEEIEVNVDDFENDLTEIDSEDAALTVLIHLGYLSYDKETGKCRIPNKEIAKELIRAINRLKWSGIANPISKSGKLLEETLKGNTDYIDEVFDKNHAELSTTFSKNKEDVLSTIALISYYEAKEVYDIFSEPNCPTGRADLLFTPLAPGYIPIIIELKVDHSPDEAIRQIKDRNYVSTLNRYHGKVMLLGIAYDSKTLKHHSKIEYVTL